MVAEVVVVFGLLLLSGLLAASVLAVALLIKNLVVLLLGRNRGL
jgi:hypothetical protein